MKIVGVFRVKNHDFTPKNHIFPILGGGGACRVHPPGSAPVDDEWISRGLSMMVSDNAGSK